MWGVGDATDMSTREREREREREIILLSSEVKYDLWEQKYYISRDTCESE